MAGNWQLTLRVTGCPKLHSETAQLWAVRVDAIVMCIYTYFHTHWQPFQELNPMRTNIEIDDKLMNDALKATGLQTKKEAVELGLKTLIKLKKQEGIKRFRGKLQWSDNLDEMRSAL
jgi:Arc/MetJ family transcription regulator